MKLNNAQRRALCTAQLVREARHGVVRSSESANVVTAGGNAMVAASAGPCKNTMRSGLFFWGRAHRPGVEVNALKVTAANNAEKPCDSWAAFERKYAK